MKKTILIIDDDALVLKSLRNILKNEGCDLRFAKSTSEAEACLKELVPDLVISDIRMPGEDGISFFKRLKQYTGEGRAEVPVLFITGYASEEAPIDAIKLGAKDYILKPFDLDELLSSVRKHLK